ncbi:MAG: ABC transporter substrate-binding protein [Candidatus Gastranaerophilales bacterium]|nr:ABC transporter substrate-binding protein [Candidatus Gastranaerophilales bacterium]
MKKHAYNILIIIFSLLLLFLLLKLVFKKDYGFDTVNTQNYEELLTPNQELDSPKNITINGIDYLQTQAPIGKFGGVLKDSIMGDPKTFNPYNSNDATSSELASIMYDGLLTTNPFNGEVIPKLAKSFKIKEDKKTYIIKLRKGLKWSDGKEITADDVYFTYNTVIFEGFGDGSSRDVLLIDGKLPKIEKIDKYTIKFTTPKPFAPFLRNLSASILPKHIFEPVTKKGANYFLSFQGVDVKPEKLVISGAFKLKEYVPSQRVVFVKNPNYYLLNKNNEHLPYIDKWVNIITGDLNNQTLKFESGEIDLLAVNGSLLNRYRELKKHSDFDLYNLGPSTNTTFMLFNLNNRKNKDGKYYVNPIKQKWLQDKNFRSAIDWAIDRQDLILNVFSGLASPLHSSEPILSRFLNQKVAKGHSQNLDYAKSLLKKSGFYYKNDQLFDKYGNKVELELLTNAGNTQREAAGVSIKQDLEKLGIKINFKPIEFNSLVNKITNEVNFDCIILALTSNILEPNSGYNVWTPNGALHIFNKRTPNDLKSSDKVLDFEIELEEIFKKGALELDFNKRKKYYDRYQEIIAQQNPLVYLYAPLTIYAIRQKIKNIYPSVIGGIISDKSLIYIED